MISPNITVKETMVANKYSCSKLSPCGPWSFPDLHRLAYLNYQDHTGLKGHTHYPSEDLNLGKAKPRSVWASLHSDLSSVLTISVIFRMVLHLTKTL